MKLPVKMSAEGVTMRHAPRILKVEKNKRETDEIFSLTVRDKACADAKPGQFAMIWIPGVDEIPMSIFPLDNDTAMFVVKNVGEATQALVQKKIGDKIGVRGPYGTFFKPQRKGPVLLVGGGTGIVPLAFLMRNLSKTRTTTTLVIGARTKSQLFFLDRTAKMLRGKSKTIVATDDGTRGVKGFASEIAVDLLKKDNYTGVFACGPEQMIRTLFDTCEQKNISLQASLERIMKCGIGICGSCCIGGYRVCAEGPVFQHTQLREVADELGRWTRDHSGKIVRF